MPYADGFLLVVPKKNLDAYKKLARKAGKIWREHGALEYRECVADDLSQKGPGSFRNRVKPKRNEIVVFSWIVYKSRAHRDKVNQKVMADPRLAKMKPEDMPFDLRRMSWGGFQVLVDL
jgi:uncharacterized protein YbaA (DUF1428 family)